ncbi:Beta,beta-carotene 15,15'-monooxygenase [Desmophyllum pertusum]|uniref:Beta,beta-carotene 15,15'-monooxygenase n=1 Tax=Desmophyllum pertusum TaxID=174260 RepID=A0A9W9Z7L4_9CNID|nr:Beta,beta-carotene 15,15'-monooxygenase [Desmophyllum pertusum]
MGLVDLSAAALRSITGLMVRHHILQIDPNTLETLNKVNFAKEFPGDAKIKFTTAHPQRTDEGSVINISVTHAQKSTYDVIEIPPSTGKQGEHPLEGGKLLCSIPPTSGVAYIHSFCITENYVVVPETPLVLNLWEAYTRRFKDSSAAEWFQWKENQRSRFHVVDRKQGSYAGIFTADPFFVFHQVNAFEDDGKIFLDACCFHDHKIIDQTYLHNMRSPIVPGEKKLDVPDVRRYELPLEDLGDVKAGVPIKKKDDGLDYTLLHSGMEFPKLNDMENNGKRYKFVYGVGS